MNAGDPREESIEAESHAVLRTLLAAAQLPASDAEIDGYAAGYGAQRAAVDALYAVPEARYVEPALRFRAADRIEDWAALQR